MTELNDGGISMLTKKQIEIIKQTVHDLERHGTEITGVFYKNMLGEHPELLNVFNKTNQTQGRQKTALATTILAAAKNIENLEALLPQIKQIGHKHRALNIRPAHYPIVGNHLLRAIKEVLGEAATDDIIDAWGAAYQVIADAFIKVEREMYDDADWADFSSFRIQEKQSTGTDICQFVVVPVDDSLDLAKLTLKAGQYITVKVRPKNSENDALRHYSLCSINNTGITFAVRRDNRGGYNGLVSNYLHDEVSVGDTLLLSAPAGDFVMNESLISQSEVPLVLISAGVGITPILSMLEQQIKMNPMRPIIWVYACQNIDYLPFSDKTEILFSQAKLLKTHFFYSEESRRIDKAFLATLPKPADIYICGSMRFMEDMISHLSILEHSQSNVHYEPFGPKMSLS